MELPARRRRGQRLQPAPGRADHAHRLSHAGAHFQRAALASDRTSQHEPAVGSAFVPGARPSARSPRACRRWSCRRSRPKSCRRSWPWPWPCRFWASSTRC
ncbi:MAG: hypothetical protein MZV70_56495 [Desulfobacterales bacterium]|nr:hypothetical protein [Desulfobacterales bacterium]